MPKVLRRNLPKALFDHLSDRVQKRQITGEQLMLMVEWLDTQPEVPAGEMVQEISGNDGLWRR